MRDNPTLGPWWPNMASAGGTSGGAKNRDNYVWGVCEGGYTMGTRLNCTDCPICYATVPVFVLNFVGVKGMPSTLTSQSGEFCFLCQECERQVHNPTLSAQPPRPIAVS